MEDNKNRLVMQPGKQGKSKYEAPKGLTTLAVEMSGTSLQNSMQLQSTAVATTMIDDTKARKNEVVKDSSDEDSLPIYMQNGGQLPDNGEILDEYENPFKIMMERGNGTGEGSLQQAQNHEQKDSFDVGDSGGLAVDVTTQ